MCADGEFGNAIVDGPLDVRVSCDKESMEVKGIHSPIDGDADVLLFSDIEAANSFIRRLRFCSCRNRRYADGTDMSCRAPIT